MVIIPAIDLRGGRCVRLVQGAYDRQLDYAGDPVDVAKGFVDAGAELIHVVDLDGAKMGEPQNWPVIEAVAKVAPIEVGGGIRSLSTAHRALDLGVQRVIIGTRLVQDSDVAHSFFDLGERIVAGIDAKDGLVAAHGWTEATAVSAVDLAREVERSGCRRIILTDISRDGMLTGPNSLFLREVMSAVKIPVIASGGVGQLEHIRSLGGILPEGVIVGRALYEGAFTLTEALEVAKEY